MKTLIAIVMSALFAPIILLAIVAATFVVPPPQVVSTTTPSPEPPAAEEYPEALPLSPMPSVEPTEPQEDDPEWDCRTMGNLSCGVEISGVWYVVTFEDGVPTGVRVR